MSIGGFFKGLGKGALKFGGLAAAPFTGGASLIPGILGAAGSVASGISGGRGQGRQAEAATQLDYDEAQQRSERAKLRQLIAADLLGAPSGPVDPRDRFAGSMGSRTIDPGTLGALRSRAQTPGLSPLPKSGKMDSFLNVLGAVGQFGGALTQPRQPRAPVATMGQFQQQRPFFQPQRPDPWSQVRF